MTASNRKRLRWLLSSGAFLIVLATGGCARVGSAMRSFVHPKPVCADECCRPAQPGAQMVLNEVQSDVAAVNLFGEFDGAENRPPAPFAAAGFQQHTQCTEGYDAAFAVDASGKWLVFASTRHREKADLYMQRVDGQSVTQLTSDAADDAYPSFSADGSRVAFCSTRSGNWDIYVMDRDGRNVTQVTDGAAQDIHPSFSPDGTRLVYSSLSPRSNQWELWTVDLSSRQRRMIGYGLFASWSPAGDGDRIAFQRARHRGSRWFSIWTLQLIDGEARNVSEIAVSTNAALVAPKWSPDGKRLTFSSIVEPAKTVDARPQGEQDIWTVNADGTDRRRITDGIGSNLMPFWAVDNRVYFVSDRGGNESVWSARVNGGSVTTADTR